MADEKSFAKLFDARTVTLSLDAKSRDELLARLVDSTVAAGKVEASRRDAVLEAVLAREGLGSTGIGGGIAIPHAKTDHVSSMVTAIGIAKTPLDFKSVDGEPCDAFFLLLSPKAQHEDHLAALRWLSRLKRNADFPRFLRAARTPDDVLSVMELGD